VPGGLHAHLSSCPAGTRLGEANVHNRRCLSRRVRYLRTEAAPTYPRPEGGTSQPGLKRRCVCKGFRPIYPVPKVPRVNFLLHPFRGAAIPRYAEVPLYSPVCKSFSTASARMRILEVCGAYPSHSPGSKTPGTRSPTFFHDPGGVASDSLKNLCKSAQSAVKTFPYRDSCREVSTPICLRAWLSHDHLTPCPEGTRLGEANVHNRRCLSRRVRYLRTEAAPTYPRPESGTSRLD